MHLTTFCELGIKKVQVKTKDQNRNPMWANRSKSRLTLTHFMIKQKRNLKDETDLKITFKILHNNTKELVTLVTRSPSGHLFRFVCTFSWSRKD